MLSLFQTGGSSIADAAVRVRRKEAKQIGQIGEGVQPGAFGAGGMVGTR